MKKKSLRQSVSKMNDGYDAEREQWDLLVAQLNDFIRREMQNFMGYGTQVTASQFYDYGDRFSRWWAQSNRVPLDTDLRMALIRKAVTLGALVYYTANKNYLQRYPANRYLSDAQFESVKEAIQGAVMTKYFDDRFGVLVSQEEWLSHVAIGAVEAVVQKWAEDSSEHDQAVRDEWLRRNQRAQARKKAGKTRGKQTKRRQSKAVRKPR